MSNRWQPGTSLPNGQFIPPGRSDDHYVPGSFSDVEATESTHLLSSAARARVQTPTSDDDGAGHSHFRGDEPAMGPMSLNDETDKPRHRDYQSTRRRGHRGNDNYSVHGAIGDAMPSIRATSLDDLTQRSTDMSFQTTSGAPSVDNADYYIGHGGARIKVQSQKGNSFHRLLSKFESLDYDVPENDPYMTRQQGQSHMQRSKIFFLRWVVMALIGVITAVIACMIDIFIDLLANVKFKYVLSSMDECVRNDCLVTTLLIWLGFGVGFVSIATFLVVFIEPVAAGSGIPEIKCFLNGVKIPHVVRFKTLLCKAVGIVFSVAGGMPVGKEGPMIHSGAVVAAGVSQGRSQFVKFDPKVFRQFRLDHEKRDFVSGGAAAGVAAAFGAPVGGVLFSLEEGASFWNQSLTWRMFFASMTAVFTLNIILSAYNGHVGDLSYNGLLDFGTFAGRAYYGYELVIFIVMGAVGGLIGALFNHINYKLSIFRRLYVDTTAKKFSEPLLVVCIVICWSMMAVLYTNECHYNGQYDTADAKPQLFCSDGKFHAMGLLIFTVPEQAVKTLFHAPPEVLSLTTVFIFASIFFCLSCWTYGLGIPSGLFVPCILLGAAWGRGVGTALRLIDPTLFVEPGKYALIGAAATLGGVVRMTISLTVIIVESTGDVTYGLPIMLTVMMAKWIGDLFNEGLYDIHIDLQGVPLLPWEPPPECVSLTASDIMSKPVRCARTVERVGVIARLLEQTSHHGFPVVDKMEYNIPEGEHRTYGHFRGLILRSQLVILLKRNVFSKEDGTLLYGSQPLNLSDFEAGYPRIPSIRGVHLSPQMRDSLFVNLKPYINPMPYTVHGKNTMHHVFKPFRALGLRHIVVVDDYQRVVGIVTRKDLSRYREVHGTHSDARIMRLEVL